jgi:hypothetical protein
MDATVNPFWPEDDNWPEEEKPPTIADLWLEFELWHDDFDRDDEFFNMAVILSDGRRYALSVWTYKFLERARREDQETGENLHGAYLAAPDLFVERLDRALLETAINDMIRHHRLRDG